MTSLKLPQTQTPGIDTGKRLFSNQTSSLNHPANRPNLYSFTEDTTHFTVAGWAQREATDYLIRVAPFPLNLYLFFVQRAAISVRRCFVFNTRFLFIPAGWYESWWMRTAIALLVISSLGITINRWLRRAQWENQRLESLVAKRTEALQTTLDQLKKSEHVLNRQVHLQSRLMASIVHDIQSPLQFMTYTSRQAHQLVVDQNYETLPRIMEAMAGTTENTSYLLNDLLSYSRTQLYEGNRAVEPVDLHALLTKKIALFTDILHAKQNTFVNEIPAGFQVSTDSHLLGIIIHNLLDNAIKHTRHGHIRVHVCPTPHQPHLIITNQGIPINAQTVAWFNQPDDEPDGQPLPTPQKGSGLLIIKELASVIDLRLIAQQTDVTAIHLLFGAEG